MELKKSNKIYGDYYIGLDIGTNSVGIAATDLNYNLKKDINAQIEEVFVPREDVWIEDSRECS